MDATEAQLRFGASLTHTSDPSHPSHPLHPSSGGSASGSAGSAAAATLGGSGAAGTTASGLGVLGGPITTRRNAISLENPPSSAGGTRIVGFSTSAGGGGGDNGRNYDRDGRDGRREFLTYALSLMRAHSSEHRDSLPVLDVTALRHIAYVLDGIVFYMRSAKENDVGGAAAASAAESGLRATLAGIASGDISLWPDVDENDNDDTEDELQMDATTAAADDGAGADSNDASAVGGGSAAAGRRQSFFQRSESTLCLGCPPPDPFGTPMFESLPLADQPHLLQPNARREELFGIPKQPITLAASGGAPHERSPLELPPTQLGLSPHATTGPNGVSLYAAAPTVTVSTSMQTGATVATAATTVVVAAAADATPGATQVIKSVADATVAANSEAAGPSGSVGAKRKLPDSASGSGEGFGNIYMQLKKKNFYNTHYDTSAASSSSTAATVSASAAAAAAAAAVSNTSASSYTGGDDARSFSGLASNEESREYEPKKEGKWHKIT